VARTQKLNSSSAISPVDTHLAMAGTTRSFGSRRKKKWIRKDASNVQFIIIVRIRSAVKLDPQWMRISFFVSPDFPLFSGRHSLTLLRRQQIARLSDDCFVSLPSGECA
jgi:hypothetical protein